MCSIPISTSMFRWGNVHLIKYFAVALFVFFNYYFLYWIFFKLKLFYTTHVVAVYSHIFTEKRRPLSEVMKILFFSLPLPSCPKAWGGKKNHGTMPASCSCKWPSGRKLEIAAWHELSLVSALPIADSSLIWSDIIMVKYFVFARLLQTLHMCLSALSNQRSIENTIFGTSQICLSFYNWYSNVNVNNHSISKLWRVLFVGSKMHERAI